MEIFMRFLTSVFILFAIVLYPICFCIIKEQYESWEKKHNKNQEAVVPTVNHLSRENINLTNDILLFIDRLIEHESLHAMYQIASVGTRYDVKNLDNDVEKIANRVYEALNPSVLNESMIMTSTAMMSYIVKKTTYTFTNAVVEYNRTH